MPTRADRPDAPHLCFLCGLAFEDGDEPWGAEGVHPSHIICPCCGVELGYEDSTLESVRRFRAEWQAAGMAWNEPDERPAEWDTETQLTQVPERAR